MTRCDDQPTPRLAADAIGNAPIESTSRRPLINGMFVPVELRLRVRRH